MDELGDAVKALRVFDLVVGDLDDVVAHARERGGALCIGETCGFAIVGGTALAFQDDAHAVGGALDEDVRVTAGFVIQRARGFTERDAHVVCDMDAQAALVAGERDEHGGLYLEGRGGLPRHVLDRPTKLFDAAQACGLLGERGDIRRVQERCALPHVGVFAVDVVDSFPTAVGRNELKRDGFIELLLRSLAGLKHCKRATHLVTGHEQLIT